MLTRDGRIVVDAASYNHKAGNGMTSLTALDSDSVAPTITVTKNIHFDAHGNTVDPTRYNMSRIQKTSVQAGMQKQQKEKPCKLPGRRKRRD